MTETDQPTLRADPPRGELFVLSAPSGTGKTTLIQRLFQGELSNLYRLYFAVSHTTRQPRASEVDGRDYHFVDEATFLAMISGDAFLEWAEVHNNYYGTSIAEVGPQLANGIDVLMDIDVQGAEGVMSKFRDGGVPPLGSRAHSIFLMPPSFSVLRERLLQRNLDDTQEIARRLAVSHSEIKRASSYDYVIVNDDAQRAGNVLASIIVEKRFRRDRMTGEVAGVLDDFVQSAQGRAVSE